MIHIAVLLKPYLDMILAGTKTVECRLTRDARAPFEAIDPGERIYFKQSAGPYRATAIVDHVLFESGLTPKRVREIQRDYDDLLGGGDWFWRRKRNARYCTLVWIRDVEPIDAGPAVRPLQGVAWVTMEEEPAWRRHDRGDNSFHIEITEGNLRNGTLYVTKIIDRFPDWTLGGATKREAAPTITLMLHDGPTVETDIVAKRKGFRTRVWRSWFRKHGADVADRVVFTPVDDATYFVGLAKPDQRR